jgi:L-rhamnono-1,4-lactonase
MFTLSRCSKTYMKLSGCLVEMTEAHRRRSPEDVFEVIFPWLAIVLATFGPTRTMFGSDWPVCTVGVGEDAWDKWKKVVDRMCDMASLSVDDMTMLWSGTAKKAYGIQD